VDFLKKERQMADENGAAGGSNPNPGGDPSSSGGTEDKKPSQTVAYESYQKVLDEKKRAQAELRDLTERMKRLEDEKLRAEGNKDKLLERYQKRAQEAEARLKEKTMRYAER